MLPAGLTMPMACSSVAAISPALSVVMSGHDRKTFSFSASQVAA